MKPEYVYERRQSAGQIEAVMFVASVIGAIAATFALFNDGWLPGLTLFLLSLIAFALSRVFDLLAELLAVTGRFEEIKKLSQSAKGDNAA